MNINVIIALLVKYIIEGLVIALVAYYIPRNKMEMKEILYISVIGVAIIAVLDRFSPFGHIGFERFENVPTTEMPVDYMDDRNYYDQD